MYLPSDSWSSDIRQGDVVHGITISGLDLEVASATALKADVAGNKSHKATLNWTIATQHFAVVSQCCDVNDERVLLCPLLPQSKIPVHRLTPGQLAEYQSHEVQVDEADPLRLRVNAVLIGYFHYEQCPSVFDESMAIHFAMIKGIRKKEFRRLEKKAQLKPDVRAMLRRRLAMFFARTPDDEVGE